MWCVVCGILWVVGRVSCGVCSVWFVVSGAVWGVVFGVGWGVVWAVV